MAETQNESYSRTYSGREPAGGSADKVKGALRDAADSASEMWDDAYEQGRRYYRRGTEVVPEVDATMVTGWVVAGAIGFGLGWLFFGAPSRSADEMTRRMSESSNRRRH